MATDTDLPADSTPTDAPPADDTPDSPRAVEVQSSDCEQVLLARIEEYADDADECTIYPANATAEELPTTWITAEEGSFVPLEAMR